MNQVSKSLKKLYLLFQPVIVLDNACHYHISALHVESDLSCRLILEVVEVEVEELFIC